MTFTTIAARSAICGVLMAIATSAAAAPVAWTPAIKGLTLWLKADEGLATSGASWADKSGKHDNAKALSGQAPTYVASGLNGLPVASFSGGQVMSIKGSILKSQRFTILAVATDTSSYSNNDDFREIVSNWSTSNAETSAFLGTIWTNVTGTTEDRIRFTDAIGGAGQSQSGQGDIPNPGNGFILTGLSGKSNACVYLDGKSEYCLGSALPARNLAGPWSLGRQGSLNGEYWQGDIAEVLVYNRPLTTKELKADIAYLKSKWGL